MTIDRVVVLPSPTAATKKAVRRVRKLVGTAVDVVVVGDGHGLIASTLASAAFDGLAEALRGVSGVTVVVRADAQVTAGALSRLLDCHADSGGIVVARTNAPGTANHADLPPEVTDAVQATQPAASTVDAPVVPVLVVGDASVLAPHADALAAARCDAPVTVAQAAVRSSSRVVHDGPLLVANLIVRDESENLPDCLASLEGLVDRIEVCDTGSEDDTVSVASRLGAVVSAEAWRNDFSAARNAVLGRSRDAAWVLWIDADERVVCDDPQAFRARLAKTSSGVEGFRVAIANRNADGSTTSTFQALRVFRAPGTQFEGAVHEQVRRHDGGHLTLDAQSDLRLDHFGYDESVVGARSKRLRNLAIARAGYHADPGPKTAYELARSIRATGGDPAEAAALFEEAVAGSGDIHAPGRAHVLASFAQSKYSLGDAVAAWDHALAALVIVPAEDQASAVAAEAAHDLGRHGDLVALAERLDGSSGPEPLFLTGDHRARFHSLVAVSYVLEGDLVGARRHCLAAPAASGEFTAYGEMMDAIVATGSDAVEILSPLFAWDGDGDMTAAAVNTLDPADTASLCAAYLEAGGAGSQAAVVGVTAAAVAGRADLVGRFEPFVWSIPPDVADRLAPRIEARGLGDVASWLTGSGIDLGFEDLDDGLASLHLDDLDDVIGFAAVEHITLTDDTPHDAIAQAAAGYSKVLDLADLGVGDHDGATPADAVVAGPDLEPGSLVDRLTPAGVVITWGADAARRYMEAGYAVEVVAPIVLARPPWTREVVEEAAGRIIESDADIVVVPVGLTPRPELAIACAASAPGHTISVTRPVAGPADVASVLSGLGDDQRVLVVPSSVVPDPAWVQALVGVATPAGVGLLGSDGARVHAGADAKGRAFGRGARPAGHPIFSVARDARLLPPFVATAGDVRVDPMPQGRYLGPVAAVSAATSDPTVEEAGLRDGLGETVLVLSDGTEAATGPLTRAVVDAALSAGRVPVVFRRMGSPTPWDARRDLASGVIPLTFSDVRPVSVAGSLQPSVIAVVGTSSLEDDFTGALAVSPHAHSVYAGADPDDEALLSRVDIAAGTDAANVRDAVSELIDRPLHPVVPEPAVVSAAAQQPGVVSVVIPVWNRADLTEVCLDRLAQYAEAPLEIIVVDNGSTDATPALLAGRDVTVITNETNLGFPRAVNQGIKASTGEFVCVLNNDTEVTAGWLREMLVALAEPGTGLVGPRSNRISGWQEVSTAPDMEDIPAAHRWAEAWTEARSGTWLVARLVGFCLLGRRDLFEEVGGFDESFGIGNFEDDELCARVRRAGYSLRVADGAIVLHHGGATFDALGVDYDAVLARAARGFGRRPSAGLLSAIVLADDDPREAVGTAIGALALADRVRIVARSGLALHELAGDALGRAGVEVMSADWQSPSGAATAVEGIDDPQVIVLAAGERIDVEDIARVRERLGRLPAEAVAVGIPGGEEVRIHPPGPAAIEAFGTDSDVRLAGIRVRA